MRIVSEYLKDLATRQAFGQALVDVGEQFPRAVVLDADLSTSTHTIHFAKAFPDRFFNMGIAEANMVGTAAGLALTGHIPFIASFACFVTSRYDTIRISVCYNQANVKIAGTHSGIAIGEDGTSQMGLEDVTLMRGLPGMQVFQPSDAAETAAIIKYMASHPGPMYIRLTRQVLPNLHDKVPTFTPGPPLVLREGSDLAILATGGLVHPALEAAKSMASKGIDAAVIAFSTIKPLDADAVRHWARRVKLLVTAEDHNIIGGLGSAVAEVIADRTPVAFHRIGVPDVFGESGSPRDLYEKFGFDPAGIAKTVSEVWKRL